MPLTKEQIRERGHAAKAFLEHETFNAVCEDIARAGYLQWASTTPDQIKEREDIHRVLQGLNSFRDELKRRVSDWELSDAEDERQERRKKEI